MPNAAYSHKEIMGENKERSTGVLQGTLDMLVLKALGRGPLHGYDVAEYILTWSGDVLHVEEGALYPALHRLELRGLLASEWGVSANNRRAKFYHLTRSGRSQLRKETDQWTMFSKAVGHVLGTLPEEV